MCACVHVCHNYIVNTNNDQNSRPSECFTFEHETLSCDMRFCVKIARRDPLMNKPSGKPSGAHFTSS